jgi:hypothetical protein
MDKPTYAICEVVADLMWNLAIDLDRKKVGYIEDSREVIRLCIEWAEEFETRHAGREWDGEYMEEIETFYQEKTKNL